MTTNRSDLDRAGDAVHDAYRPFALTRAQRREHREHLAAAAGRRGVVRLRAHITEVAAIAAVALIAVAGFLYWNSLDPGFDGNDAALADMTATDVKCLSDLDLPNFSMPPEVQEKIVSDLATEGYVDCTTQPALDPTPTGIDCVPFPDALGGHVPADVTQQIREDTVYCPPEPTPPYTPSPTPAVLPTSQFAGQYGYYYGVCRATPYVDDYPPNPRQAGFTDTWFGGESFGLWAGLDREMEGIWTTSNTVLWATHDGPFAEEHDPLRITIEGRRLDGAAPPLETEMLPAAEPPLDDDAPANERDAQALIEMRFPEPGCWEVVGWAGGDLLLSFVVEVVPEDESAQAIRARQHREAIAAEREAAIPFPVPDTCAVDPWTGPENRLLSQYPAEMVGGDDWTYSYFLDGSGMSLNSRLSVLYEGTNTVFWVSVKGRPPGDDIYKAELLDGESAGEEVTIARAPSTYSVELPSGVELNVEPTEIDFPSAGCWELRIETDAVDFTQTVYVYPSAEALAEAARDHERLYVVDSSGRIRGIDLEANAHFLEIETGGDADVALSPNGLTLYTPGFSSTGSILSAYDALTGEERWSVDTEYTKVGYTDGGPPVVATSPDGRFVYVYGQEPSDSLSFKIYVHESETGERVASVSVPVTVSPRGAVTNFCAPMIWSSTAGEQIMALCHYGANYHLFDMAVGELIETAGTSISGVAVSSAGSRDGTRFYVAGNEGDVAAYNRDALEVVATVDLASDAEPINNSIALSPDGTRLYLTVTTPNGDAFFREIRIYDTASWKMIDRIELDFDGYDGALAVDSADNLYGVEWLSVSDSRVWERDATTGEIEILLAANSEVRQLLIASGD